MSSQDINPQQPTTDAPEQKPASARFLWLAIVSLILTVVAWVAGSWNGYAAVAIAAVAIVLGAMALRSRRHRDRNLAITSIIAAAVLLVVIVAFFIVIYLGLKSI